VQEPTFRRWAALNAPPTGETSAPAPAYSIIGQPDTRTDGQPAFIVTIDPVDTSSDEFKSDVRSVLTAVSTTVGGDGFSAKIFDDKSVAEGASFRTPFPAATSQSSPGLALEQHTDVHLVAWYSGGMSSGVGYPYDINWYPGADRDTPGVGAHVGSEEWRP